MADQHESDVPEKVPHHPGGGCLSRHVGKNPSKGVGDPCSHRWQAYEKMKSTSELYDWPKYKPLHDAGERRRTARTRARSGNMFPKYYRTFLDPPGENEWDVKDQNFFVRCYDPYWHEAHHVVPNSTLGGAIASVGDGKFTTTIRRGLAKEKYNLNDKKNMVMLPMDKPVAQVLGLPRHRQTATVRSHQGYSRHVQGKLDKIMSPLANKIRKHEPPKYDSVKSKIEDLSDTLFKAIVSSESASLDDMDADEFESDTGTF